MALEPRKLAILVAFSGLGGVERVVLNLLQGFAAYDIQVDLLPIVRKPWGMPAIKLPHVRIVELGIRHSGLAGGALAGYLKRERPDVLLAVRDRAIRAAVLGRALSGVQIPLVGNLHSILSAALAEKSSFQRWLRLWPMRRLYRGVDRIIAISQGVAEDVAQVADFPRERLRVVRNPVLCDEFFRASREPASHPWLTDGGSPVIMGAGRLSPEKGFSTLIRAFAHLRARQECRLLIFGEGKLRPPLESLIVELKLEDCAALPGFIENPYACMAKADLFALSSLREGSGNVLTEAMALGVPVVATDCPTGPGEMLAGGRYGRLVPVGDAAGLAEAMEQTLAHPLPAEVLRAAVGEYSVEASAKGYLQALGLLPHSNESIS
ncbi:MAG: glycosyltransferase [Methylococcaceae bacterium]|nr:glycosyltransferase [Methylococcaceae bacterium]